MSLVSALVWIPRSACSELPRRTPMTESEFARSAATVGMNSDEAEKQVEEAILREAEEDDDDDDDENLNNNKEEKCDSTTDSEDDTDQDDPETNNLMEIDNLTKNSNNNDDDDDSLAEFNMHLYDEESDTEQKCLDSVFGSVTSLFARHQKPSRPPKKNKNKGGENLLEKNSYEESDEYDNDERDAEDLALELEELRLLPSDAMLCVASTSDGLSTIEFQVCEDALVASNLDPSAGEDGAGEARGLYAHHDSMVPGLPLCVEFVGFVPLRHLNPTNGDSKVAIGSGAFLAVGTMEPEIELWDVDVIDTLAPFAVLGGSYSSLKTKKLNKKTNENGHNGPVLALSWNSKLPNMLASGSADGTVRIWDLETCTSTANKPITPHDDGAKVCAALWSQAAPSCVLTGGHDSTVRFFDVRTSPDALGKITINLNANSKNTSMGSLSADPEALSWNSSCPFGGQFYVITDDGHVRLFDLRSPDSPIWTLAAHQDGSSLSLSRCGRHLATVGGDMAIKIWDVSTDRPSLVHSRNLGLGSLFSCAWCPDSDGLIAVGGSNGSVVLDLPRNSVIHCNSGGGNSQSDSEDRSEGDEN